MGSVLRRGHRGTFRAWKYVAPECPFPVARIRMPLNPQPISDQSDYFSKIGRSGPSPITHLPVNALTGAIDPTQEIRTLIEQLQDSARDARAESQVLQEEKEELGAQLENALRQIDQLRSNEREIRSQFVEITSLIRERDTAVQEVERLRRAAAETLRQCESAVRDRNDTQRQRDDLARLAAQTLGVTRRARLPAG